VDDIVLGTEYPAELSAVLQRHWKKDMLNVGRIDWSTQRFAALQKSACLSVFSDGTYSDYHGTGDTAERVDYTRLAGNRR
jgi:hypothetical protein